ncbi:MAG: hypothetical protein KF716_12635 [Anaerolineae bacterium]|nr:hypothetical protein [Anaerolineae bacterium]
MHAAKQHRLTYLDNRLKHLDQRDRALTSLVDRFTWLRLAAFFGGVVLTIAAFYAVGVAAFIGVFVLSAALFIVTTLRHQRLSDALTRVKLLHRYTQIQQARINLAWDKLPPPSASPDPKHPFEGDLDLAGERSLLQMLDTTLSRNGSDRLRSWLTATEPSLKAAQDRQALVRELAPLDRLRNKLFVRTLSSTKHYRQWDGDLLENWLDQESSSGSLLPILFVLAILAVINVTLFVLNFYVPVPGWYRAIPFIVYVVLSLSRIKDSSGLFENTAGLLDSLRQLQAVLITLETFKFGSRTAFRRLCEPFLAESSRPSVHLRIVSRLMSAASIQTSQLLWLLINAAVPWDITVAYFLRREKARLAALLPAWLEAWFEIDALNALANFAWLNPDYTFPTLQPDAAFDGRALGHPLIPADRKVTNDIQIVQQGEVVIITGSNMSGKSSFLRTLGINLSLAYAGTVVNADSLRTPMFRIFTCIKVSDSLVDGFSYFYAEVRRLKQLLNALDADHPLPLFFLIDEIFRGTNNRERLIGSRSYIHALVGKHGSGLISTHDLELVRLADELPNLRNFHFADDVRDGQMTFDYRLRSGPCPTTNALRIMTLEGLPIDEQTAVSSAS